MSTAFTAMRWRKRRVICYISAYMPSTPGDVGTEILGYGFTPPGNMEYIGNTTSNLPPFLEGNVTALQSVTDHGPHGDETAPRIYAVYADRKAEHVCRLIFVFRFWKIELPKQRRTVHCRGFFLQYLPTRNSYTSDYMSDIAEGRLPGTQRQCSVLESKKTSLFLLAIQKYPAS